VEAQRTIEMATPGRDCARADAPLLHVQPIELDEGWSGRIVTQAPDDAPRRGDRIRATCGPFRPDVRTRSPKPLPAPVEWKSLLRSFVADRGELPGYEQLKYTNGVEVAKFAWAWEANNLDIVAKCSRPRTGVRGLVDRFRRSRERRTFDRALTLTRAGIASALPLAIIERRRPRTESWVFTEYLGGVMDLDRIALKELPSVCGRSAHTIKKRLVDVLADLAFELENADLYHRDFKASNIMIANWNDETTPPQAILIDLDGVQLGRSLSPARRLGPLVRLAASLVGYDSLSSSDFGRFLRCYMGRASIPQDQWRSLFRRLRLQVLAYNRKAGRRKIGKLDAFGN
jgi:hypothetical protein